MGLQPDGQIISRCGLICNTCTAYMTGACPGCHMLETGECVIRDCADLLGTSCLDCQADACYHFEAYAIRRQLMNSKAKQYYRRLNPVSGNGQAASCGGGGCASGGGCRCRNAEAGDRGVPTGCAGCPALRIAEKLAAL